MKKLISKYAKVCKLNDHLIHILKMTKGWNINHGEYLLLEISEYSNHTEEITNGWTSNYIDYMVEIRNQYNVFYDYVNNEYKPKGDYPEGTTLNGMKLIKEAKK